MRISDWSSDVCSSDLVEGQRVEAGKVLFRIDPEPFEVALQQAEARLKNEQALLRQAERSWARVSTLYKDRAVSGRERDETLSILESSRAGVASAEAEVRAARIDQIGSASCKERVCQEV